MTQSLGSLSSGDSDSACDPVEKPFWGKKPVSSKSCVTSTAGCSLFHE